MRRNSEERWRWKRVRNRRREKTDESGWLRDTRGRARRGVGLICANGKWDWGHMAEEKGLSPLRDKDGGRGKNQEKGFKMLERG